jgi:hypothetical protein
MGNSAEDCLEFRARYSWRKKIHENMALHNLILAKFFLFDKLKWIKYTEEATYFFG